jgi:hypothetical protein
MAVVPDKITLIREKINLMNKNLIKLNQFINEFEFLNQEEDRLLDQQNSFVKNESIINDSFFSNSSPSSTNSYSNDSISSLVTEPSKKIRELSETNIRKLRSTNTKSSQIQTTNIKENSKNNFQKKRNLHDINIYFNLDSNELIDDLIKKSFSISKIDDGKKSNQLKFKNALNKILEKLEIIDMNRMFTIESIKYSSVKEIKKNENILNCFKTENNQKDSINDHEERIDYDEIAENNNKTIIDENLKYLKTTSSIEELKSVKTRLKSEIDSDELKCNEEVEKKNKYKVSNCFFLK